MSTNKHIDQICAVVLAVCVLLTAAFVNSESLQPDASAFGYETRLFDTERVHSLEIVMDRWDEFLQTCENEEYASCSLVIDGEAYKNVAIRAKGNTSLSMVSTMDSSRYSFKLEFDHYDSGKTYYGLDKLSLNNIIQDSTYMKDYLTYQMMRAFGVDAPLCSYVFITVNGEDWGLYLAVEGVEDAFLQRNYGSGSGNLYKPDSMNLGGGRGNGREFSMGNLMDSDTDRTDQFPPDHREEASEGPPSVQNFGERGGGIGGGDVKLRYVDDDPESYSNIFQNAKTEITEADQARLIAALKNLSAGQELETTLDIEEVLRYFVVHNFVCNGDSYTGSIVHNYYLYEENGQLSMIPWDYNLAYGTFDSGSATAIVNSPIDTPVSGHDSRPMVDWIFSDETYKTKYHQYFQEFLEFASYTDLIDSAERLIDPFVEKDPTKFYTYEEFETGVQALRTFCRLRAESVRGQLTGAIPSTAEDQAEDSTALVDASSLVLSDMGTSHFGGGPNMEDRTQERNGEQAAFALKEFPGNVKNGSAAESFPAWPPEGPQDLKEFPQVPPGENGAGRVPFSDEARGIDTSSLVLLAVSVIILLIGILFSFFYRRMRR